jgi:hypothetical protein
MSLRDPTSTYSDYQFQLEWNCCNKSLKQAMDTVSQLVNLSTIEYHPGLWAARTLPADESISHLLEKGAKNFANRYGNPIPTYYDPMWDQKAKFWRNPRDVLDILCVETRAYHGQSRS